MKYRYTRFKTRATFIKKRTCKISRRSRRVFKTKNVSFHPQIQVILIESHTEYDQETRNNLWWTSADYEQFLLKIKTQFS